MILFSFQDKLRALRSFLLNFPIFLTSLLIFVWPMNLFITWLTDQSYVHGLRVDYLIPKVYLSQLVMLVIVLAGWQRLRIKPSPLLLGWLFLGAWQLTTSLPVIGVAQFVSLSLAGLSLVVLSKWQQAGKLSPEWLHKSLLITLVFQLAVGAVQFIRQASIFPSYVWFGETRLANYSGVAHGVFDGVEKILPYGTTSHPNIWASVCVLCSWLLLMKVTQKKWAWTGAFLIVTAAVSWLSQSLSASLMGCVGAAYFATQPWWRRLNQKLLWKIVTSILLAGIVVSPLGLHFLAPLHPDSESISRRVWLNQQAVQIWTSHPLFGIGLGQFTTGIDARSLNESTQFVQPAHNLGLLILAESGTLGVLLLTWTLWQLRKSIATLGPLVFLFLPGMCLDHFFLTNQVGVLTAVIAVTFLQPTNLGKNVSQRNEKNHQTFEES